MESGFQLSLTIEPMSDFSENEPNSSHVEYRGDIRLLDDEGEALAEIIGPVKFYVIHFANSWPAFDVFDVDTHTAPYCCTYASMLRSDRMMSVGTGCEDSADVSLVDSPASIRIQNITVDEIGNQVRRAKANRRRLIRGERHADALARGGARNK